MIKDSTAARRLLLALNLARAASPEERRRAIAEMPISDSRPAGPAEAMDYGRKRSRPGGGP